jgi:hypothetical protein
MPVTPFRQECQAIATVDQVDVRSFSETSVKNFPADTEM